MLLTELSIKIPVNGESGNSLCCLAFPLHKSTEMTFSSSTEGFIGVST